MSDTRRSIPASLSIGLALSVVTTWIAWKPSLAMIDLAGRFAGAALATAGWLELAKRLPAARARAATIAAIGFGLLTALWGWDIVQFLTEGRLLRHGSIAMWMWPAAYTAGAALVLALAAAASRGAAEAPEQHAIAVGGLRRATIALWLRLGSTSLAMTMVSIPVLSLQRYAIACAAVVGAFAMIVFATAVVRVATASGTGLPRWALQIAAFLALWSAVMQSAQAWFDYKVVGHHGTTFGDMFHRGPGLPLVTPIAAAAGIAILIRAVVALARAAGDEKLERTAKSTFAGFLFFAISGALLIFAGGEAKPGQNQFLATAFGVTFGVGGLVLAASLCSKAAAAIEARPGLATATLKSA